MARVNKARLSPQERAEIHRELLQAFRSAAKNDVSRFLTELLTPDEILMLGRRIRIAKALLAGERYEDIATRQKASYSTIQLVDAAIQRGLEGYRRVVRRMPTKRRKHATLPNETIEMLRHLPGSGTLRFWLAILDTREEK